MVLCPEHKLVVPVIKLGGAALVGIVAFKLETMTYCFGLL
jgi:hypothetical protein